MYDMHYSLVVRKIFSDRARLVVYVEAQDLNRLTEKARDEGRTLVEWARERLLEELEAGTPVRRVKPVRVVGRRALSAVRSVAVAEASPVKADESGHTHKAKCCKHGTAKGHNCWQCGGIAVME